MTAPIRIVSESGSKKVFVSALDWPGWSRSGKTEEAALATLADYTDRYQRVVDLAGEGSLPSIPEGVDIVERLQGSGATDFGVPDRAAQCENEPMTEEECERQIRILRACWRYFDDVVPRVSAELRKGPRGGGRDRDEIVEHVLGADRSYARNLGVKTPEAAVFTPDGLQAHRDAVCEAVRDHNARGVSARKWPVRYFLRRAAWHVLDHAWEMEDKDLTPTG